MRISEGTYQGLFYGSPLAYLLPAAPGERPGPEGAGHVLSHAIEFCRFPYG
jgi:hypothetical protein